MRLFQNSGIYPSYLKRLNTLASDAASFEDRRSVFLNDRFGALHFLKPVLDGDAEAFFTNGDDEVLQRLWARQNGLRPDTSLETILLSQIEQHRTEVFYNLDPVRYPSAFARKLPASVKKKLCWRAAPSGEADLTAYDAVLGNFPSILESWRAKGCRAELFFPAVDPVMEKYACDERPIDLLFVGGYSRHHKERAKILEAAATLGRRWNVVFHLDVSRLTRIAETPLGIFPPLRGLRRPTDIQQISNAPKFGCELYKCLGESKIVLNGAIDMAGRDRGNMRCFEAMGCGAMLLSDEGVYPEGMEDGKTFVSYNSHQDCVLKAERYLNDSASARRIAADGRSIVGALYDKDRQWAAFKTILERM